MSSFDHDSYVLPVSFVAASGVRMLQHPKAFAACKEWTTDYLFLPLCTYATRVLEGLLVQPFNARDEGTYTLKHLLVSGDDRILCDEYTRPSNEPLWLSDFAMFDDKPPTIPMIATMEVYITMRGAPFDLTVTAVLRYFHRSTP